MSLIRFDQLRISSTLANAGLQAYTDGTTGESTTRVAAGTGISLGSGGVQIDTGSTVSFSGETWTYSQGGLNVNGTSFAGTDVPNADWISSQIATGVTWKFPVLAAVDEQGSPADVQLDSSGDAVRQAIAFYLDGTATAGDTFRISDGVTTETWTGVAGVAAANQFSVDTGADEAMTSLATRISADSTLWDAVIVTQLNAINDGSGTSTAGTVLIIYRTVQAASKDDRIFSNGANTSQTLWQYVNFNGEDDYTKSASSQLPSADPAQKEFGPGTITASLTAGEAHLDLNSDSQWVWDADGATWTQISGTGSITAGAGLTKSGSTININSGTGTLNGIQVNADSIGAALAAAGSGTGGLEIVSNEIAVNAGDGILLDANGVGIDLATNSGLNLTGTSPNKELTVVGYDGIVVDANGVNVDLEAAGSGTGGLEFKGTAPNREIAVNPGDGILLDANGVGIDLATNSGLALTGTSPNKELTAVGYDGIVVDANGINVDLEAAGSGTGGLTFAGTTPNREVRVLVGNGIQLTASGVEADLAAAGAGTGGLEIVSGEIAVNAGDGILLDANGVGVDLEAAGSGTGGLRLVGTSPNKELGVDPSDGIGLDANGVLAKTATAAGAQQYGGLVATRTSDGSGAASAGAGYLAVQTDNTNLEINASNQIHIKALGVDTAELAANAATIDKLGIQFNVEEYAASTFTAGGAGAFHDLTLDALVGSQVDDYNECFRNGVADMTNVQSGGSPSGATQYRVYDTGSVGRLEIGADITASGNTYRVRFLSAL